MFQVEYAQEAVKKGSTAVSVSFLIFVYSNERFCIQIGVRGKDCIAIGVEKKSIPILQDDRTIRKIHRIDEHVMLAFAGTDYFEINNFRCVVF